MTHSQLVHAWNIYLHLAYFLTFNVLIDQNSIHEASGNTFLQKACDFHAERRSAGSLILRPQ